MEINKIPTVEEILVKNNVFESPEIGRFNIILYRDGHRQTQRNIKQAMIEFAELHVKAFSSTNLTFEEYIKEIQIK